MKYSLHLVALLAKAGTLAGCAQTSRPKWLNPGSSERQAHQAERWDPYPEEDVGPEILGGRPKGFEHPVAEPRRARWWERFGF